MAWLEFSSSTPTRKDSIQPVESPAQQLRVRVEAALEHPPGQDACRAGGVYPAGWEVGENSSVYPGRARVSAVHDHRPRRPQRGPEAPRTGTHRNVAAPAPTELEETFNVRRFPLFLLQPDLWFQEGRKEGREEGREEVHHS